MTTMDATPTIRQFIAMRIAGGTRVRSRPKAAVSSGRLARVLALLTKLVMHIAGFGCLTMAAFTWTITAGWIMAGVSFLLLSWLLTPTQSAPDEDQPTR